MTMSKSIVTKHCASLWIALICLMFCTQSAFAQNEVNGRVTSSRIETEEGESCPAITYFRYYYDFYVNGCNDRPLWGEIIYTDENGKTITFQNGEKCISTFDLTPDQNTYSSGECCTGSWNLHQTTLSPGKHTIKAKLRLLDKAANKYIEDFICEPATLSVTMPNFKVPYAKVIDYEMKHNLTDNNRKCLKIYYDLYIRGLKDHELVAEWIFTKENGTQLYFNNGKVAKTTLNLTPNYNETYWYEKDKYQLNQGVYYDAIKLPRGKHSLKAKMRLYDKTTKRYINFKAPVIDFTLTRG